MRNKKTLYIERKKAQVTEIYKIHLFVLVLLFLYYYCSSCTDNDHLKSQLKKIRHPQLLTYIFSVKGSLLSSIFVLGTEMKHLNNNNNSYVRTAATIFTLAIIAAASSMTTAPIAEATTTTTELTTTPSASSSGLELSPQPVLRERQISLSQTPINQTHILFTDSGNGTITLPNTTEAINFTGTDSVIVSTVDGTAVGKEVFTTLDGSESVTATINAIARFNMEEGTGRGIVILLLDTNSTGRLAPVDGMILVGHIEFYPDGTAESTMWEWQSGIPLLPAETTTPAQDSPPPMETPTATDATADDTTTAAAAPEEGGEEG